MSKARTFKFNPKCTTRQPLEDENGNPIPCKEQALGEPIQFETGPEPVLSGHVVLRVPSFDERMQLLEDIGLEINEQGVGTIPEENKLKMTRKLVAATEPYYVEVDMKHVDGSEYKSFDDLSHDLLAQPVLMEVAHLMQSGIRPGKN